MRIALAAKDLCSLHGQTQVFLCTHIVTSKWIRKTRPTASGFKFCFRQKQGISATQTIVSTLGFSLQILSAERPLCTFLSTDFKLFGSQLFFPLHLAFGFKVSQGFFAFDVQQYFYFAPVKTMFFILSALKRFVKDKDFKVA